MRDPNGALKFQRLATVALLVLTLPHSNAEEERVFSLVTKNKTKFRPSIGGCLPGCPCMYVVLEGVSKCSAPLVASTCPLCSAYVVSCAGKGVSIYMWWSLLGRRAQIMWYVHVCVCLCVYAARRCVVVCA